MPYGIKVEVGQGIDFLQVINTTLYAKKTNFAKDISFIHHNTHTYTCFASFFPAIIRKVLESVEGLSWAAKASVKDVMSMCWQLLPMVPSGMWCWKSARNNQPENLLSILTRTVKGQCE
jgi:hypothetical protein